MGGRGGKRKRKERRGGGEISGGKRRERSTTLGQVTSNHTTQYAAQDQPSLTHPAHGGGRKAVFNRPILD